MIKLIKYNESLRKDWNNLVDSSFNGSFMQTRTFLDYHKDKFIDASILITKNNKVCAVFPAAFLNNCIISHPGLTTAGLIYNDQLRGEELLEVLIAIKEYFNRTILYKTIPIEFHRQAISDDIWALFKLGATKISCDLSTILNPLMTNYEYWPERKQELNRLQNNITLSAMPLHDISFVKTFWETSVIPNLTKYNVTPTHTPEDIVYLYNNFPIFIKGLLAQHHPSEKILGGLIIFRFNKCYHVQYSATTGKGRALNVLALMHHYMIENLPSDVHYYNFGKSTENGGHKLNESLYYYKNSFGGGSMTYDTYEY
jgi:hypothetical protein